MDAFDRMIIGPQAQRAVTQAGRVRDEDVQPRGRTV